MFQSLCYALTKQGRRGLDVYIKLGRPAPPDDIYVPCFGDAARGAAW